MEPCDAYLRAPDPRSTGPRVSLGGRRPGDAGWHSFPTMMMTAMVVIITGDGLGCRNVHFRLGTAFYAVLKPNEIKAYKKIPSSRTSFRTALKLIEIIAHRNESLRKRIPGTVIKP